ncbi:winged helix-turn-helix domain-containing protein [Bradyrhizobium sp. Tv2a-2]|uniref:winged helix-turn-helix domain-containing protein n=1 Tax=Bradyrhizobium sp. Tv2a-2 TaxID=113395 RepID=UPI000402DBDA|nr:winged helix-turn-helix domain-containing protein [Bradyrhizobium sp. Tv2a-2]
MLRFAGFELDPQRAELRSGGEAIRLRPKSFDMLQLFATNAGRVLSKQELIEQVWPNVFVSDDSLFQCIREIRTALGDERRELIRLVSGRGYLLDVEVIREPDLDPAGGPPDVAAAPLPTPAVSVGRRLPFGPPRLAAFAIIVGLAMLVGVAVVAPIMGPGRLFARKPPAIVVMPITVAGGDTRLAGMAAGVTERLTNGLAGIDGLRVVAPRTTAASFAPQRRPTEPADFLVSGELQTSGGSWQVQARMVDAATGEVRWTTSVAVSIEDGDTALQQSRLAAGLGHPLAVRLNALLNGGEADGGTKVVIEQASAIINQNTRERFRAAQAMLEKALATDTDNVDIEVALASHLMRGIQTVWYDPADVPATESRAREMLERALKLKPTYLPAHEAYCRFLSATNALSESLVACARALSFDPWDGTALFNLGMTQIMQGRFEDALATFKQADGCDTPQVSRWTWLLGAGVAYVLMERWEEALPWLERSLAITPGTGRTQMVLAAVYHKLGREADSKAAMAQALALRPGSNAANFSLPTKNTSQTFRAANDRIIALEIQLGLPER